jgi:prepilin-type N-terminal cleavage/methylation domain-containing protein
MTHNAIRRIRGFTLIELAIVVMVLGLLAAAALRYNAMSTDSANITQLNATLDVIDNAIFNFRIANGRLPCPANISYSENNTSFGQETDSSGDGVCTGYNFENTGTDPNSGESLYDSSTSSQVVAGGVPTKALQIADKYAYDPWGRKILYAVDKRITATSAFTTYPIYNTTIGAIVVKKHAGDTLANAITIKGVYALVSSGENGHGGYVRNASSTSTVYNAGSTNTDEQKNCHCNSSATATSFDRDFVQNSKSYDSTSLSDSFDDVVRFKTRFQLASPSDIQ